jgi:hypothetical protein
MTNRGRLCWAESAQNRKEVPGDYLKGSGKLPTRARVLAIPRSLSRRWDRIYTLQE